MEYYMTGLKHLPLTNMPGSITSELVWPKSDVWTDSRIEFNTAEVQSMSKA